MESAFEGLAEIRSHGYFLRFGEEVSVRGRLRGLAEAADKLTIRLIANASRSESYFLSTTHFYWLLNCSTLGGSEAVMEVCLGCGEDSE